jgi:hypothetical protein
VIDLEVRRAARSRCRIPMRQKSFAGMRCLIARALEQVGDRWALLLIRDLSLVAGIQSAGDPLPGALIDSIRRTKLALKGPLTTPVGGGFRSVNVRLREEFELNANLYRRPLCGFRALHPGWRRSACGSNLLWCQHSRGSAANCPFRF